MIKKRQVREVVLDLETTGFAYNGRDRIIEIGVVELIEYELTGNEFRRLVKPGRNEISPRITKLTGISNEDVAYEKMFKHPSVVVELLEFIGDSQIVAHNARFDRNFLNAELNRAGEKEFPKDRWIDTLRLARETSLDLSSYKLDALCDQFRISRESRKSNHGALIDARLTARVYQRLLGSSEVTKQKLKDKKPKLLINPELNFVNKGTAPSKHTFYCDDAISSLQIGLKQHLNDATGLESELNSIIPYPHSASSHYFPLAVLMTATFTIARWATAQENYDDYDSYLSQQKEDTKTLHDLIDLAGTDIESYFLKLHEFHQNYNKRKINLRNFIKPSPMYRTFREEADESFYRYEFGDDVDDAKLESYQKTLSTYPIADAVPNYYRFADFAKRTSGIPLKEAEEAESIFFYHQELVSHLFQATGHWSSLRLLTPEPHSASSPYFPIAVLATAVIKIARARIIAGFRKPEYIEETLQGHFAEISFLIDKVGTDIVAYFREMHEFHVSLNELIAYPILTEGD